MVQIELFMNFWLSESRIIKISTMNYKEEVINDFNQYIEIAKYNDMNEHVFKTISNEIYDITNQIYSNEIDPDRRQVYSFASIVGPSLMGKTQFAFSLARAFPVFYVNFAPAEFLQNIYEAFNSISSSFKDCLLNDVKLLDNIGIRYDSDCLVDVAREIKLETIGLLWEFVKYSTEFDNRCDWFKFYVSSRTVNLEKFSVKDYLQKLSKINNNL